MYQHRIYHRRLCNQLHVAALLHNNRFAPVESQVASACVDVVCQTHVSVNGAFDLRLPQSRLLFRMGLVLGLNVLVVHQ